jgi:sulfite exporter TauE/SafE
LPYALQPALVPTVTDLRRAFSGGMLLQFRLMKRERPQSGYRACVPFTNSGAVLFSCRCCRFPSPREPAPAWPAVGVWTLKFGPHPQESGFRLAAISIGLLAGFLVGMTSIGSGTVTMMLLLLLFPFPPVVGTDIVHAVVLTGFTSVLHMRLGTR